ncbi:Crp/Fnr family transcriptional regulator [Riemerella anatipestifer]|uniref:Crp/Fnr family transcriptional regulator n=1 Tax=Riemerella anatipestifer TaxID=34085 RepID=UPI001BD9C93E|nr:Crp/Fnr family transcriptional regulator [Riemerella anatipestifer]MBT0526050.1 Crp/Fnr family transcriptional regulator [Riemerella anatipestifer]MBT0527917.1 Crp/Fnr family transcriptional regulator [Riemerella anatipestifer]MBT0529957.1 Crp/Fnr family transcriptional regulator [Riemerella anatipestifer]MBT0531823.1 Crp/Fnr family transcriptional regulator [Riemerella anatipestifer]MBT0537587.1 Crp/Fnr family transcriptional regulator [Riemerella anatipestifer]
MSLEVDNYFIEKTNAVKKQYHKDDIIVEEGMISRFFYYLEQGDLCVYHFTEDGKEFLQHKVREHTFFGEPATLLEKPFPGTVKVTSEEALVIKIERAKFMEFLSSHLDWNIDFMKTIAAKALGRSDALKNIIFQNPEEKILNLLNNYKKGKKEEMLIKLTRNEMAQMLGLTVETVIRTIKKMEKKGLLKILKGKVHY